MKGFKNHLLVGNLFGSVLLVAALIQGNSPTASANPQRPTGGTIDGPSAVTLPDAGTTSTAGIAFSIRNTGTGTAIQGQAVSRPGVYGISSTSSGVQGTSVGANGAGVNGISTNGTGVRGFTSKGTYGVYGQNDNPNAGAGVQGRSTKWYGVRGDSVNGQGVWGQSQTAAGVVGRSQSWEGVHGDSVTGTGVAGISRDWVGTYGESTNNTGVWGKTTKGTGVAGTSQDWVGTYGESTKFDGVYGLSKSSSHAGVSGHNDAGGYGVWANSSTGWGTWSTTGGGQSVAGVYGGSGGYNGTGVMGEANNGPFAYGIWGKSTTGFAGTFSGKVQVLGNLSKGGGSFKIDHPLDPANQYLYHSFVESPDMMNIYNGNVKLDGKGEAIVTMPKWFEALNMEFRYQLTTIGGFAPVYIAEPMKNNRFKIAGGKTGIEVSWQVTGIRHDPYANAHRIPVEEQKPAAEQGTYLYPREQGKPESAGLMYRQEQALEAAGAQNQARSQIAAPAAPQR